MIDNITTAETIKLLMSREKVGPTQLSEKIGMSRQNLTNKLSRNNFHEKDLKLIAAALGYDLRIEFIKKEPL